jgi:hypothetical protein
MECKKLFPESLFHPLLLVLGKFSDVYAQFLKIFANSALQKLGQ